MLLEQHAEYSSPIVMDDGNDVFTNPFNVTESDNEEIFVDYCDVCLESFPSEDFVNLHKKIFHSVLKTTYVSSPEEMITSFIKDIETTPSTSAFSVKSVKKSKKPRKCLKY